MPPNPDALPELVIVDEANAAEARRTRAFSVFARENGNAQPDTASELELLPKCLKDGESHGAHGVLMLGSGTGAK